MSELHARPFTHFYSDLHELPEMPDYTKYYIAGAFFSGIALTAAYNRRLTKSFEPDNSQDASTQQHWILSKLSGINDLDTLKKTLAELESSLVKGKGAGDIKEGIEGCIGDTPLIRIKSLSDYTGCDILVKAEVGLSKYSGMMFGTLTRMTVSQWRWQQPKRPCCSKHHRNGEPTSLAYKCCLTAFTG